MSEKRVGGERLHAFNRGYTGGHDAAWKIAWKYCIEARKWRTRSENQRRELRHVEQNKDAAAEAYGRSIHLAWERVKMLERISSADKETIKELEMKIEGMKTTLNLASAAGPTVKELADMQTAYAELKSQVDEMGRFTRK